MTIEQFRTTATLEGFAVLAYCFMPDHVHLLVEGLTEAADLRRFAKLAKQRAGGVYARRRRQRLWQEGYHDRILRNEDDTRTFARYVLGNPVRAGLVESPLGYPYLGSDVWSVEELLRSV